MAAASSASDKTTEQLQKLSLGSQVKPQDTVEATKKSSAIQYRSSNSSSPNVQFPSNERIVTPLPYDGDPNTGYLSSGYQDIYYGGFHGSMNGWDYNGSTNGWDEYLKSVTPDGAERPSGVYSYAPYGPYPSPSSPIPTLRHDSPVYGTQHYQYSGHFYQQPTPSSSSVAGNNQPFHVDATNANSKYSANLNTNRSNTRSSITWFDAPSGEQVRPSTTSSMSTRSLRNNFTSVGNQNNHYGHFMGFHSHIPTSNIGSATPGFIPGMYPNHRIYNQYGSALRNFDVRSYGLNSHKPTSRGSGLYGYRNENSNGFSELNRGPRAGHLKNPNETRPVTITAKGQDLASIAKEDNCAEVPSKEFYNQEDFPVDYSEAKFFIIKSYSEDDIHKSIKYSVWASTPNGNKKLDAAYQESQGKDGGCPIFLFFSVNTSGQFVGVAGMAGPVDFNKTVEYWQQDKWVGCFPVKWHIIKDVPNNVLKHITLENNDNKPVTNSRDTQEVKLEQGLQMLKIFKGHVSKTSILDDFAFYEKRQKMMLEKKAKQHLLPKQVLDEKIAESDKKLKENESDGKPFESVDKESSQIDLGEQKPLEQNNGADEVAAEALKPANGFRI